MAKMTLWGIEAFLKSKEESVFDQLVLPVGITKDDVVDNIFLRAGEFEVLFADPDFLKYSIGVWGRKYYKTFEKWITALNVEYNPLENYDRVEEWTDNNTENSNNLRTNNLTQSNNNTRTDNLTQSNDNTRTDNLTQTENSSASTSDHQTGSDSSTVSGSQETVNLVSAFDSSTFSNKDKQNVSNSSTSSNQNANDSNISSSSNGTISNTGTVTENSTVSNTGTVTESGTMSNTGTISDVENSTANNRHTGRIHGNIGVTTSQQMLLSELDVAKWNLIEQITDLYISEFCIAIY